MVMSNNGIDDPNKDKTWLHSEIYDWPDEAKNKLPRTSILKFGSFGDLFSNAGKLIGQSLISWFLSLFFLILLIDPVLRHDDQSFVLYSELIKLTCFTISVFLAIRIFDDSNPVDIGLKVNRRAIQDFAFGFILIFFIFAFLFLLELISGWIRIEGAAWDTHSPSDILSSLLLNLIIFVFVGWSEELLSCGFQLRIISKGLNRPLAIILSSAVFSYMHRYNPETSTFYFIFLFLFGILMCFVYLRTGQLWLAIGLHTGWDFFGGVVFWQTPPIFGSGIFHLLDESLAYLPSPNKIFEVPVLITLALIVYFYTANRK